MAKVYIDLLPKVPQGKHLGSPIGEMAGRRKVSILEKLAVPSADHIVRVLPDGIYIRRKSQSREGHARFQEVARMAFEHNGEGYTISEPQTNKRYGGYSHLLLLRRAPGPKTGGRG